MIGKALLHTLPLALLASLAVAQPADNVSGKRNPNIAAAQHLVTQAYEKIVAAQKSNEYDMQGHAQKAKDLLDQANRELKMAAEIADKAHR